MAWRHIHNTQRATQGLMIIFLSFIEWIVCALCRLLYKPECCRATEIIRNADAMLRKHDNDGAVVVTH